MWEQSRPPGPESNRCSPLGSPESNRCSVLHRGGGSPLSGNPNRCSVIERLFDPGLDARPPPPAPAGLRLCVCMYVIKRL